MSAIPQSWSPSPQSPSATSTVEWVDEVVKKARVAQPAWARLSPKQRSRYLARARNTILDHRDHIVKVLHEDNGKPIVEALSHEIIPVLHALTWACKRGPKYLRPKRIPMLIMKHKKSTIHYIPHGVIGVISPWNFPFSIPLGEVITALLAGNAVVLKPSEVTPKVTKLIVDVVASMRLPKDVFQMVEGGPEVGKALVASSTNKIIFTGSSQTGQSVMHACVDQFKPFSMELGGKDAMIVLEDADIEAASSAAVWGSMCNAGQVCASTERLYVHQEIYGAFEQKLLQKIKTLRMQSEQSEDVDIGSITLEKQKALYDRHLADAKARGKILVGGKLTADRTQMLPTVVTGPEDLACVREETFGPLVYLAKVANDQEALQRANASVYGLLASVWSSSRDRAQRVAKQLQVGTVLINDVLYTNALTETPWGGRKASGVGHVHGEQGLMEMVYPLHVHEDRFGFLMKPFWWFPYSHAQYQFLESFGIAAYAQGWRRKLQGFWGMIKNLSFLWREPRL